MEKKEYTPPVEEEVEEEGDDTKGLRVGVVGIDGKHVELMHPFGKEYLIVGGDNVKIDIDTIPEFIEKLQRFYDRSKKEKEEAE